jgi:Rieske Fe-S protein
VAGEELSARPAPGKVACAHDETADSGACRGSLPQDPSRRQVLHGVIALATAASVTTAARAAPAPKSPADMRPQEGDVFVFAHGDREGEEIKPEDLKVGDRQVLAWPRDPKSGTVRDGSLLNQVLLIRLAPDSLEEEVKAHAAEGILAFSAICTHQQCPVTGWNDDTKMLHCDCHQSEYDPREGGKKVTGPAPRGLPALPVRIDGGLIVAAGSFLGRVGAPVG